MKVFFYRFFFMIALLSTYAGSAMEFTYWEDDAEVLYNFEYVQFYESYYLQRIDYMDYDEFWLSATFPYKRYPDLISHMGYYDIYLLKSDVYLMDIWRDKEDTTMAHLQLMFYNKDLKSGNPINVKQIVNYHIQKTENGMRFVDYYDVNSLQTIKIDSINYYYDRGAKLDRSVLDYNRRLMNFLNRMWNLPPEPLYFFSFKDNKTWFEYFGGNYDLAWTVAGKKEGGYTDKNAIMYSGGFPVGYSHEILNQLTIRGPKINTYIDQGFSILFGQHQGQDLFWHCNYYLDKKLTNKNRGVLDVKIPHVTDGSYVAGGMVLAELFKRKKLDEVKTIAMSYVDDDQEKDLIKLIHDNLNSKIYNTKTLNNYLDDLLQKYADPKESDFRYLLR